MLIILYMAVFNLNVIVDGVTFSQISHRDNSNDISNSEISSSFNHSQAGPRDIIQVPNVFNDNLTDPGFAHATTNDGTFPRHLAVIHLIQFHYDLTLDHIR
jgi:hypothetical protein